jgi:hypothetical protein
LTGSQYIVDPKMAAILGHELPASMAQIGYWVDQIAGVSCTTTAKIKLGGTQIFGTGADYLLPTAARCVVAVRPKIYNVTPTTHQSVVLTLKVESSDLGMKDFEVFANPIESTLATNMQPYQDAAPWYPLMQPCNGGEKMQFYGTAQITNTAAVYEEVDVLLSDTYPEGFDGFSRGWRPGYGPVQAKVAGINYGGGPTNTGTTAGSVATDAGVTIAGPKKRLIGLFGIAVDTTPTASNPIAGQFTVNASELAINPQRWVTEPITGFLGTTTAGTLAHISSVCPINLTLRAPSTPKATFTNDIVLGTAGNFEVGYMYIDNP